MNNILKNIENRKSARAPYDPNHKVSKEDLNKILEGARWAPSAHNMQNFEIVVVDDKAVLEKIGNIKNLPSEEFIRENFLQLSSSEQELLNKKTGIIGNFFPLKWRDKDLLDEAVKERVKSSLKETIKDSPAILIVIYDKRKRAPASPGDVLGILGLGCVMENMWLVSESLGISFQVMSVFSEKENQKEIKKVLNIPDYMEISYACRLGYPLPPQGKYLRVRRDIKDFTHYNSY